MSVYDLAFEIACFFMG